MRLDRYSTTAVPQLGVGQATRNAGTGPYVGESSEAPGGTLRGDESTQWSSTALMGGMEFNDGNKLATHGNGLDDDWQTVMGMCSLEMTSLKGNRLMLDQQNNSKSLTSGSKGIRLMLNQQHHTKI